MADNYLQNQTKPMRCKTYETKHNVNKAGLSFHLGSDLENH